MAEGRLAQLTRAKERKLKQQLLQLENDVADAEDEADLARIMINFYEHLDSDKGSKWSEVTEPVALEKAVKENFVSFIPGSFLEEPQPRTIIPDLRVFELNQL